MKLRFTGTLSGERTVKKKNTREYRRAASLLIDDRLLIDARSDLSDFIDFYGFSELNRDIDTVLLTEADTTDAEVLLRLSQNKRLSVFGPRSAEAILPREGDIDFHPLSPFSMSDIGGYKIFALPPAVGNGLNYAICRDRAVLYLPHGGILSPAVIDALRGVTFDALIAACPLLDAPVTGELYRTGSLTVWRLMRQVLLSEGILGEHSRFLLTALPADRKHPIPEEFFTLAAEEKMTVACDGYFLSV